MDSLSDLKDIWQKADTDDLPTHSEMAGIINRYRNQKLWKKIGLIIVALLLTGVVIGAVFNYKSVMLTTRLGEACLIISAIMLIAANLNSVRRFYNLTNCSNKEFIEFLKQGRAGRIRYYRKTQVIALCFNSAGLLLYLFEFTYKDTYWCITAYSLTILYLLIMWLIVRPKVYNRQMNKLNKRIEDLERIAKQF